MGVNDAREQLEVAKAEVVRLEQALAHERALRGEYQTENSERKRERDSLARLHEVATERTVQLAAVIERARYLLGLTLPHTALDALNAADTDAALREVRAKAWDEGFNAALREVARRQGKSPVVPRRNPHREEATE